MVQRHNAQTNSFHKPACTTRERGGFRKQPGISKGLPQPCLQKKVTTGKAERLYAAGLKDDNTTIRPEDIKSTRRRGPKKEYELSSYAVGNYDEDFFQTQTVNQLETGPKTDCRADCRDGAIKVAKQAMSMDPTCPYALSMHTKMRHNSKSSKSTVALLRKAELFRRSGELKECIEVLDELLDIDPMCAVAWTKRGDCVARLGIDDTRDEHGDLREGTADVAFRGGQPGSAAALHALQHFERAQKLYLENLSSGGHHDRRQACVTAQKYQCWNRLGHTLAGKHVVQECNNFPQVGRLKSFKTDAREKVVSHKTWDIKAGDA
jgi:tetratricopeptide (TPR) repeat protein